MLQSIRNHAQGWIAWVIVGLIIITFALFGIEQYARGDKAVVVAEVNGEPISGTAFMSLYNRQKARLQEQFGDLFDQVVKDEELRNQVLNALVESELMRQWSNDKGMLISDPQLASAIQAAEVFQENGKFSQKIYEDVLLRNGLNVARFEMEQRQYLLESQFRLLTLASAFATDSEVAQLAALQGQERNVNYLRIDQRPFLKTVEVSDQAVKEAYESDLESYVEAEKVAVDYIELSQAELAKNIQVNDDDLKAYFAQNEALFTLPEKRQAKHILISHELGEEDAQKKVAEVQEKLAGGASFESLAKTYSQDPGSASNGGDLGSFEQGMMVPAFDEAVFSMQVGDVSEPVKTDFGYHIIKLSGIDPKQVQAFATVKAEVSEQYKTEQAEKQYFELLEQLNTIAYEQPDSLAPAADVVGLTVKSSELFGREGGPGAVLSNPLVIKAAFSDDVLKSKLNSSSVDIGSHHAVVLRVKSHKPERQKALEEVAPSIKERLVRQAAVKEAAALASTVLERVKAGENPESLMRNGIEWNTVGWIARNSQRLLPQMVGETFKVAKPADGTVSWGSYQLPTGDTVLIQISGVRTNAISDDNKTQLKSAFAELMANAQYEGRIDALLSRADVVKHPLYLTIK